MLCLQNGQSMEEIDNCDFYYFLDLMSYHTKQKGKKEKCTIDQIF